MSIEIVIRIDADVLAGSIVCENNGLVGSHSDHAGGVMACKWIGWVTKSHKAGEMAHIHVIDDDKAKAESIMFRRSITEARLKHAIDG